MRHPSQEELLVLPNDIAVERLVLGGVFAGSKVDPDMYKQVAETIRPDTFFLEKHKQLFRAMGEAYRNGLAITPATVIDALDKLGTRGLVGTFLDLAVGPEMVNLDSYCRLLNEKATLREMYAVYQDLQDRILREEPPSELMDLAVRNLARLTSKAAPHLGLSPSDVFINAGGLNPFFSPDRQPGIMTPWLRLNESTMGLKGGQLIVLGARTGIGKTSFAGNLMVHCAFNQHRCRIESHEMPAEELLFRLICGEAAVDSQEVRAGCLSPGEHTILSSMAQKFEDYSDYMIFSDKPIKTVAGLGAMLRYQKSIDRPVDLLIIDLLQKMRSMNADSRRNEVAQVSEGLKELAMEFGIPILALAQLKVIETKEQYKHAPTAEDFSESKAIGEAADMCLILRMKDEEQLFKPTRMVNCYIVKQRNGRTGQVPFYFIANQTRYTEIPRGLQEVA